MWNYVALFFYNKRLNLNYSMPLRIFSANNVLLSTIVIVNGPTPPGTGVIAPATSLTSSNSTSPFNTAQSVLTFHFNFIKALRNTYNTLLTPSSKSQRTKKKLNETNFLKKRLEWNELSFSDSDLYQTERCIPRTFIFNIK